VCTSDPARCRAAGVPVDREFETKPALVRKMLARVVAAGVTSAWFAADSGYCRDTELRLFCHGGAIAYVMAVSVDLPLVVYGGATSTATTSHPGRRQRPSTWPMS